MGAAKEKGPEQRRPGPSNPVDAPPLERSAKSVAGGWGQCNPKARAPVTLLRCGHRRAARAHKPHGTRELRRLHRQIAFGHKGHRRPQTARFARVAFARRLDLAAPCERVFGRQQLTVNTVPRTGRTVAELTPKLIGPDRFGIQIETTPEFESRFLQRFELDRSRRVLHYSTTFSSRNSNLSRGHNTGHEPATDASIVSGSDSIAIDATYDQIHAKEQAFEDYCFSVSGTKDNASAVSIVIFPGGSAANDYRGSITIEPNVIDWDIVYGKKYLFLHACVV